MVKNSASPKSPFSPFFCGVLYLIESVAFSLSNDAGIKNIVSKYKNHGDNQGIVSWEHCPMVATERNDCVFVP